MVPEKIELAQIALQVLPADVPIDGDETAPNGRMATFRSFAAGLAGSFRDGSEWARALV
jgi:hypothetical protein